MGTFAFESSHFRNVILYFIEETRNVALAHRMAERKLVVMDPEMKGMEWGSQRVSRKH